ncbi:MAG: hypothetical protein RL186_562 [Pseudomonadota bacterium]
MKRRTLLGVMAGIGGLAMMKTDAHAASDGLPEQDIAAIKSAISDYERLWKQSDLDGMAALYAPNVHWVNVKAMHWRGPEEVDRAHRIYFDIMFKGVQQKLLAIESIVQLAPTVAVVVVHWHMDAFTTPDGHLAPPHESRMTIVYVKSEIGWKIAHGANIDVDEGAARFDPIRGSAMLSRKP